jgi:RimJ/RimL family protein N-acetyltransferase
VAVLETERLLLEAWSDRYLDEYLGLLADRDTMRFLNGPRTREQGLGQFNWYERHWRSSGFGPLWAVEKEGARWVGLVGLRYVEREPLGAEPGDVEIGWIVAPSACGRGYATEAARAMRDHAFAGVGLHSIIARMASANGASVRVAEKLAMRLDKESPDGEWRTYRLTRAEWATLSR